MRIGIYIHEKIWEKTKKIAHADCRTVSGLITKLLMAEITRHGKLKIKGGKENEKLDDTNGY